MQSYSQDLRERVPGVYKFWPERAELEQVQSGDQRVAAAALSLGQDLAGNACAAFSMIGDLDRVAGTYGDCGYRYVHFEAGAIGQRLYLAAEARAFNAGRPRMLVLRALAFLLRRHPVSNCFRVSASRALIPVAASIPRFNRWRKRFL